MSTINYNYFFEVLSGDRPVRIGSFDPPLTYSSLTQLHHSTFVIPTATTKIVLALGSASTDDLPDLDFAVIISSQETSLEIMGTTQADNSNVVIKANIPFVLSTGTTRAYSASGAFAGATQAITRISARQVSGSNATLTILAAT